MRFLSLLVGIHLHSWITRFLKANDSLEWCYLIEWECNWPRLWPILLPTQHLKTWEALKGSDSWSEKITINHWAAWALHTADQARQAKQWSTLITGCLWGRLVPTVASWATQHIQGNQIKLFGTTHALHKYYVSRWTEHNSSLEPAFCNMLQRLATLFQPHQHLHSHATS